MLELSYPNVGVTGYTYSGASWLLNCMIELGIYTDYMTRLFFKHVRDIDENHTEYETVDFPHAARHYIPALTFNKSFIFRNDFYVCHLAHSLMPKDIEQTMKVIVMIRDPRDALWSQFSSDPSYTNFHEWVKIGSPSAWLHFNLTWLTYQHVMFVPFEGIKTKPFHWLRNILNFLDIDCNDEAIQKAIEKSTSERSREAEKIYAANTPKDQLSFKTQFNRSGKIQQWKELPEHHEAFKLIERYTQPLISRFGYL